MQGWRTLEEDHLETVEDVRDGEQRGGRARAYREEEPAHPHHRQTVAERDGEVTVDEAWERRGEAAGNELETHGFAHGGARGERGVGDSSEERQL